MSNLKFGEKSLVTRRFGFHSNSQGTDGIKNFPVSVDFRIYKQGVVTPV